MQRADLSGEEIGISKNTDPGNRYAAVSPRSRAARHAWYYITHVVKNFVSRFIRDHTTTEVTASSHFLGRAFR